MRQFLGCAGSGLPSLGLPVLLVLTAGAETDTYKCQYIMYLHNIFVSLARLPCRLHILLQCLDTSCIPDPNNSFCQQQARPDSQ